MMAKPGSAAVASNPTEPFFGKKKLGREKRNKHRRRKKDSGS